MIKNNLDYRIKILYSLFIFLRHFSRYILLFQTLKKNWNGKKLFFSCFPTPYTTIMSNKMESNIKWRLNNELKIFGVKNDPTR